MKKQSVRGDCPWYGTEFRVDAAKFPKARSKVHNRCFLQPGKKCEPTQLCIDILEGRIKGQSWSSCQGPKLVFM